METKVCSSCGGERPITSFRLYDKRYRANKCRRCSYHSDNKKIVNSIIGPTVRQKCCVCGKTKQRKEFYKDFRRPKGVQSICKACVLDKSKGEYKRNKSQYQKTNRNCHLKREYGITTDQYNQMVINQNSCCEICDRHIDDIKNHKLYVDHNHGTNKIRGLICGSCNRLIALAVENQKILQNAITYLNKYNGTKT
jgi:hypothetical protein